MDPINFKEEVHNFERALIENALIAAGGSVTKAARLLQLGHHQTLSAIINSRHQDLLVVRTPIRKRYRHLMVHPKRKSTKTLPEARVERTGS